MALYARKSHNLRFPKLRLQKPVESAQFQRQPAEAVKPIISTCTQELMKAYNADVEIPKLCLPDDRAGAKS